jgi:plasmid stability protein
MATITIRNLDEKVKRALQVRAALNGRPMEAEVREILNKLVAETARTNMDKGGLGTAIHNLFAPIWDARETEASMSFEEARSKYLPDQIKLLFLAEAPPKLNSKRFFYFANVETADVLFLEMMKVLYPKETKFSESLRAKESGYSPKKVRAEKEEFFLPKFKNEGFYLIDASENPMPDNVKPRMKESLIRNSLPTLTGKLSKVCGTQCPGIVLIGNPVYQVCNDPLRAAGFRILNEGPINTPAFGGARQFRHKLRELLKRHGFIT